MVVSFGGGRIRQQPLDTRRQPALGGGKIAEDAAADHGRHRRAQTAGFLHLRQLNRQAADVGEHLHPGEGFGGTAGHAQRLRLRETPAHAVKVRHVAEHHAFVDRLHQVLALVEGLQAVEAGAQPQAGVGAIQERGEQQIAGGFRQGGDPAVKLVVVLQPPLVTEPFQVGGGSGAGFVHDVLAVFGVAAIDKGMIETLDDGVGDAAGDRPGPHHRVEPGFVLQAGAQRGGYHVEQPADHRGADLQAGNGRGVCRDASGDVGRTDNRRQGGHDVADAQQLRQRRVIASAAHLIQVGFGDIGFFAGQLAGQAIAQVVVRHQHAADAGVTFRLMPLQPAQQ